MVKKILSSIIVIMIICSFTFVYATEPLEGTLNGGVQIPEDVGKEETTKPDDKNQNTDNNEEDNSGSEITKPEDENNTGDNNQEGNVGDNTPGDDENTNQNPDSDGKEDSNPDNGNNTDDNEGSNSGDNNQGDNVQDNNPEDNENNNIQQPEQQEPEKPNQNNSGSSNNNYVQPKSSEARLKDLRVDVEGLTPSFDKNTTEYYLVVDLNVNKINVTASTVDNKAKWAVYGNKNLKEGENTITIDVTAEDGTQKEYYIHVTKVDDVELANAELETLEIVGYSLYPTFKSNIYSYNLNINEAIEKLEINTNPSNEKATVSIEGNENLQEGENLIKINVTAANEQTIRTYKINAYIDSNRVEIKEESKLPAIILIIVLGVGIVALGSFIVIKNKR